MVLRRSTRAIHPSGDVLFVLWGGGRSPRRFTCVCFAWGSYQQLCYMARKAETSERYEDMCRFMRQLVIKNTQTNDLNVEERNLLSVAYKNVIGARRATWRTLNETLIQEETRGGGEFFQLLRTYKQQVRV